MKQHGVAVAMAVVLGLVAACQGGRAGDHGAGSRSVPGAVSLVAGGQDVLGVDESDAGAGPGAAAIGVNPDLWRASLDTISFMPLASADPVAGIVITDWYGPPETLEERVKVNLYFMAREPRPDGVRAVVFRQRRDAFGEWADVALDNQMARDLEDAILAQARKLWFRQHRDLVDPYGPVAHAD